MALCGFVACSKKSPGKDKGDGGKLSAIDAETIKFVENADTFSVSWGASKNALEYVVTVGSSTMTTTSRLLSLRGNSAITLPNDRIINVSIIARAAGYTDSDPANSTYTAEGVQLRSPEIVSFEDGVIAWNAVGNASAYKVKVNGATVSDESDGMYHKTNLDIKGYDGALSVEITAVGDGIYLFDSTTSVNVSANHSKLKFGAISSLTVKDGILSWGPIGGAKAYKVADIDRNITIVTGTEFDMSDTNMILGVYPISDVELLADADFEMQAPIINYLEGKGTAKEPYLIKTPFDFRAIDYYEAMYDENKASDKKPNYYTLLNDINYQSVGVSEDGSNIVYLDKPFFGMLNGNNKKLINIHVKYNDGHWALFEHITKDGVVKNIIFENPEIENDGLSASKGYPIGGKIATVAYKNYGLISGVTVTGAKYTSNLGDIAGIASQNYGKIDGCNVTGSFTNKHKTQVELAGIAVENSGTITNCKATVTAKGGTFSAQSAVSR